MSMIKDNLFFKPVVYWISLMYITLMYATLTLGDKIAIMLFPEDHYFEILGATSLFLTAILFFYSFVRIRRSSDKQWPSLIVQLVYVGLTLFFLFGAGEEISWGQRIFNLKTPESLVGVNTQEELNLHNILVFENSDFFNADRLFDIFWFLFVVVVPSVSMLVRPIKRFVSNFIPIIHWSIGALFIFNYLSAKASKLIYQGFYTFDRIPFKQAVQEIKESNYEILFVLVGLFVLWELNKSSGGKSVS